MRRISFVVLFGFFMGGFLSGCAGKRKPEVIEGRSGRFILGYGFSIDATYDPRLDRLFPDYRTLTVAIRNTSLQVIRMDARKDEWVLVDAQGKKIQAMNSLSQKERRQWHKLPEEVQQKIDYPEVVPISYTVTFNLFFPQKSDLQNFKELRYTNHLGRQLFIIHKDD